MLKSIFLFQRKSFGKIILFLVYTRFCTFLRIILIFVPIFLSFGYRFFRKTRRLEAGFFQTSSLQLRFSIQFVFLLLIFIIFDTEILFTFGFLINTFINFYFNFFILIFLFLTLIFEWKLNKLVWIILLEIELSIKVSTFKMKPINYKIFFFGCPLFFVKEPALSNGFISDLHFFFYFIFNPHFKFFSLNKLYYCNNLFGGPPNFVCIFY